MSDLRRRAACLGFVLAIGCGEAERPVFVTEHLRIESYDSDSLCRGSLDSFEAQTVRIADLFGVGDQFTINVAYGPSAVSAHCLDGYGGCTNESRVVAEENSIFHELVHAVRLVAGVRGTRFFEEGLAEVFEAFQSNVVQSKLYADSIAEGPALLALRPWEEFEAEQYSIATHFTSWLRLTFGDDVFLAFVNDPDYVSGEAVETAFTHHFGLSLEEADDAWRATSDETYTWGELCDPARTLSWQGSSLTYEARVDCDESGTRGASGDGAISTRGTCFVLDEGGTFRVDFAASAGEVLFRHDACGPGGGLTPEHYQDKRLPAGEVLDLPFAGCTWEIIVRSTIAEPIEFSLRLDRL